VPLARSVLGRPDRRYFALVSLIDPVESMYTRRCSDAPSRELVMKRMA
jgi:hypothetical protein